MIWGFSNGAKRGEAGGCCGLGDVNLTNKQNKRITITYVVSSIGPTVNMTILLQR
jgi:hypothetical protein